MIGVVLNSGLHSLVSEYCEQGSLYDHLSGRKARLNWDIKVRTNDKRLRAPALTHSA
jgi:hypothetical protein